MLFMSRGKRSGVKANKRQVEEIAQVPGIDVLFIGPWDLGNNIGRPVLGAFHDDLNAAIDRIFKAAVDHGKRVGIYCTGGEPAKKYADQGFHMVRPSFSSIFMYRVLSETLADEQVSVVADAVALPTFLSNSLQAAKGT